jgi:TonB-linked SusC/RagA family outer membrane protein
MLLVLAQFTSYGQETRQITGTVRDQAGEALPGASVKVSGTGATAVSDEKGQFSIPAAAGSTLTITYVGFATQTIPVGSGSSYTVTLNSSNELETVQVVGYGTQRKRAITGSVASVDLGEIENTSATNVQQALRGTVAGVQFLDNGRPGQGGTILIRGQRSISANNDPLIVLDGIIFGGGLSDINPNDVQSMDVLKDASSAAIYGSRAANGVILVTTKKGKTDKPTIGLNTFYGTQAYTRKIPQYSPEQYVQLVQDVASGFGAPIPAGAAGESKLRDYLGETAYDNYKAGVTIDGYDAITQDAPIQSYQLNVSGRTDRVNYYASGEYTNNKGLLVMDQNKRVSARTNLEGTVNDYFKLGISAQFTNQNNDGAETHLSLPSPFASLYKADGTLNRRPLGTGSRSPINNPDNPLYGPLTTTNEDGSQRVFSNFYGIVNAPFIKGLSYRVNFAPQYNFSNNYTYKPLYNQDGYNDLGNAVRINSKTNEYLLENILNYSKRFKEVHALDVTLLYSRFNNDYQESRLEASNFFSNATTYNNLAIGGKQEPSNIKVQKRVGLSSMARLNYGLMDKYFLTLTIRRDGASQFSDGNKFATFPSASVAWVASDENFLKDNKVLSLLKFRASYGSLGNQAIDPYGSLAQLQNFFPSFPGSTTNSPYAYVFGDGGTSQVGLVPQNIVGKLKWETTTTKNAAIEFDLFKGRIGGIIEAYDSDTEDLLLDQSIVDVAGFTSIRTNIGSVNNKGFELTLNTQNLKPGRKFGWNSGFTYTTNKNKITALTGGLNAQGTQDNLNDLWFIGKPIRSLYDYNFDGIYQVGDDLNAVKINNQPNQPGDVRIKDLNGDGSITTADKSVIGQIDPKHRFSLTNNFSYGNLSLGVTMTAMTGWEAPYIGLDPQKVFGNTPLSGTIGNGADLGDYWYTPENPSTTMPRVGYSNLRNMAFYRSRDFIKIQNISLAYAFKKELLDRAHIGFRSANIYLSSRNVATFSNWPGYDPEGSVSIANERDPGRYQGYERFPMVRSFVLGLNLGF